MVTIKSTIRTNKHQQFTSAPIMGNEIEYETK